MKPLRWLVLFLSTALLLLCCGCSLFEKKKPAEEASSSAASAEEEQDPEYPVTAGEITLSGRPARVVSLAPALTEKLYDLGFEDRLAGISDYCDYPDTVLALPVCGTAQVPDLEELARIAPHLVITQSPLPEEAAAALSELAIPVAVFPHAGSVEELMSTYEGLCRLLEGETAGAAVGSIFTKQYRLRLEELQSTMSAYTEANGRKTVLYLRLLDFVVATGDTFEQELFDYACLDNIAAAEKSWDYPAELAATKEALADFTALDLLYMDDAFVTIGMLEQSAFYKKLPVVLEDRYLYISSIALERQSMRTLFMLEDMAAYAYPDAGLAGPAGAGADDSSVVSQESEESEASGA